jgi:molecular chaperone DnaJ
MSEKRCYYEILGVEKTSAAADIRKAFKKLALKHHPDRNNGAEAATDKFKEVTQAFQVLSDDEKRARYDQFGHAGMSGGGAGGVDFGGDIFSQFQDLFSDFFGGFGGGFADQQRRRGAARGRDLRVTKSLSLEDAVLGCKQEIDIVSPVECEQCSGSGAASGKMRVCDTCAGRGQVSTARGFVMFTQTCPSCQGAGQTVEEPCDHCDGVGWEEKERTVTVTFPGGIDAGHRLRVAGQGMAGQRGGPPGHLYVDVDVKPHDRFEREGIELISRQTVSFVEAAMGTRLEIEMLDGSKHRVDVRSGTQPGAVITAPGLGAPNVNGRGTGSLHVVVQVAVPKKLSRKAKKLLRALEDELDLSGNAAQ